MNLSCKEATRLVCEREDRPLSLAERLALQVHLAICRGCRAVAQQVPFLRRALHRYLDEGP